MSSADIAAAARLTVRCFGSVTVALKPFLQRSAWMRPFVWSHASQPMKQPWLYQKAACPLLHASPVWLAQVCVFTPTLKSMLLRLRGETIAPWPAAAAMHAAARSFEKELIGKPSNPNAVKIQ
jgi:hypothetical protein